MNSDQILIAAQGGFKSLYHYQDFQPRLHAERLKDILQNHRIFCPSPGTFNDPWDCKPYFDPAMVDDPVHRAATAEFFIANQRHGPHGDPTDDLLRTNPAVLKMFLQRFSEGQVDSITTRWGVYCLTPDPCSTLMWSHYSRNHTGICLEFGVAKSKFSAAAKVRYQKDYPSLLLYDPDSYMQMLLIKSDVWTYEDEFRLICPRFTDVKEHPLIMDRSYLNIGERDLTSIVVGCQAADETELAIRTLVAEHAPHVTVRSAKRAPNKYRLTIED